MVPCERFSCMPWPSHHYTKGVETLRLFAEKVLPALA